VQSREIAQHLRPDWTLMVDSEPESPFNKDFATFVDGPMTVMSPENGKLDLFTIERMLRTHKIQALLTVESFYDERLLGLCRNMGVKTFDQMNPEFYRGHREAPDEWWWPTPWLTHRLPIGKLMPVPVPWLNHVSHGKERLNVLHVAGKRGVGDRNGTRLLIESLPFLRSPITVTITCQDNAEKWYSLIRENEVSNKGEASVFLQTASSSDRRALYVGQDLLVMPRRFGGLCLPVLEAAGSGMAIAMTACSPNEWWPVFPMDCDRDVAVQVPFGNIPTMTVQPETIAQTIEMYAKNREELRFQQDQSRMWAEHNTWDQLGPKYIERMEEVVG